MGKTLAYRILEKHLVEGLLDAKKKQQRQVGDIMRMVNGFAFLSCACGLKMKVPPNYKGDKVKCPRCGKISPL